MSYSCTDFVDTILEALQVNVPDEDNDSPSAQADLALKKIKQCRNLLADAAASFDVQAATARQWAKTRDREANLGLAAEYKRHAKVIWAFLKG